MTYAAVPALRVDPTMAEEWVPLLAATTYDPGSGPSRKAGALAGMGMTEKQGGSDVRANVTHARPTAEDGQYTLRGHKWFTSAPMNDVFLVLAQAGEDCPASWCRGRCRTGRATGSTSCAQGQAGQPLDASSEIELDGTVARRLGDEGRGIRTIIEMVAATRLDCVLGSASLMRRALAEAVLARRAPVGVRVAARRPAADAERDRGPGRGVRGRDRAGDPAGRGGRPPRRPARAGVAEDRAATGQVLGVQADARLRGGGVGVPGGNGYVEDSGLPLLYREAPSTPSGRGPATSTPSTCCARWRASRRCSTPGSPRWARPRGRRPARPGGRLDVGAAGRVGHAGGRCPAAGRPDGRCLQGRCWSASPRRRSSARTATRGSVVLRRHVRRALDLDRRPQDDRGEDDASSDMTFLNVANRRSPTWPLKRSSIRDRAAYTPVMNRSPLSVRNTRRTVRRRGGVPCAGDRSRRAG